MRADVERDPLGKRALGGRVSAKIRLIDTAYGPFPFINGYRSSVNPLYYSIYLPEYIPDVNPS